MPNSIVEKNWIRWYPKKIFLKNIQKNKNILLSSDKFKKEDFFTELKNEKKCFQNKKESEIDVTKTKSYQLGFKTGCLQNQEENVLLKNKLKNFLLDFENSFSTFENEICSQLLQTILKIASYVIGKNINFDKSILIKYVKKIINEDGIFLKKPQIIVHSNNKTLIEDTFKDFLRTYKWTLVYDDNIDLNGCKIRSESGNIDATVDARWKELCRLLYSEEY